MKDMAPALVENQITVLVSANTSALKPETLFDQSQSAPHASIRSNKAGEILDVRYVQDLRDTNSSYFDLFNTPKHRARGLVSTFTVSLYDPLTSTKNVCWEAFLTDDGRLYIETPEPGVAVGEGRQSLVALLDTAEQLGCKDAAVFIRKDSADCQHLMHVFFSMGFELVPPNHELTGGRKEYVFMAVQL